MEAYKQIDLNDYVQTGEGGTALTYNHKDGKTLAKLFMPSVTAHTEAHPTDYRRHSLRSGV